MAQVVLIGPIAAGKSSVAEVLAEQLGCRNVPLDLVRWAYYFRMGYDLAELKRRERDFGALGR
jgi:deoxyadenosine/deoxycytidine kinase